MVQSNTKIGKTFQICVTIKNYTGDFSVDAEQNIFATAHGKDACIGVGGNTKKETARVSL